MLEFGNADKDIQQKFLGLVVWNVFSRITIFYYLYNNKLNCNWKMHITYRIYT